jgi:phosphate-selective porin OprO/OprP
LSGNLPDKHLTWAGGVFNDWYEQNESIGSSGTDFVGRGTWLPFVSTDESNLVHLGVGIRWSNAKDGVRYATEPEFNNSPVFADTGFNGVGLIDADRTWQYNLEASWRRGPYWLAAEFSDTKVESPTYGDLDFGGYHLTGSWIVTGEMRRYNHNSGIFGPVPVSRGVYQGGWGAWEVSARYSRLDLSDGPIDGGEMDILSLGLNWWLTPIFNVNANYRYVELLQGGIEGASTGINARIMLLLE